VHVCPALFRWAPLLPHRARRRAKKTPLQDKRVRWSTALQVAVPCLLPDLIRMIVEYAIPRTADFDERCLDVFRSAPGRHRFTHHPPMSPSAVKRGRVAPLSTMEVANCDRFVWIVGKETFGESGLTRWSLRIDANAEYRSVAFGISTLTIEQIRTAAASHQSTVANRAVGTQDPTGLWDLHDSAQFHADGKTVTECLYLRGLAEAREAAVLLAKHKALTPMNHFCSAGAGDAGLELHFVMDLTARTLRLQLHQPPDQSAPVVVGVDWRRTYYATHARAVRLTPSEVITEPLPTGSVASYRPALMLYGLVTVCEIEPPTEFPLIA
jgi:hypothetical protein